MYYENKMRKKYRICRLLLIHLSYVVLDAYEVYNPYDKRLNVLKE